MAPQDSPRLIRLGTVTGAHGVRGQVKIRSFTANPEDLTAYGPLSDETGEKAYSIAVTGAAGGQLIASIEGVSDRNAAESLKGAGLYIPRSALPEAGEDEFYYEDLLGMRVVTESGEAFGTVESVNNHGAGDVIGIALEAGGSESYVFTRALFPHVDPQARRLTIAPPETVTVEEEGKESE